MTYEISPEITLNQKQVLYGTILGGSSIVQPPRGKNCYLAMRDRDCYWLRYKIEELSSLFKMDSKVIKKDKSTYRCYSVAYPIFNDVYKMFYRNNQKMVVADVLETLNDVAWMIWFIDSGRLEKNTAYLRTSKFGEEGTKLIANYFNSLDCACRSNKTRNGSEIIFNKFGTIELLKIISHRMPKFIQDRFA